MESKYGISPRFYMCQISLFWEYYFDAKAEILPIFMSPRIVEK
jgi:hypothetical protein